MKIFMTQMLNQYEGLTRLLAATGLINKCPTGHRDTPFTLSGIDGKYPLHFAWENFLGRKEGNVNNPYMHNETYKINHIS